MGCALHNNGLDLRKITDLYGLPHLGISLFFCLCSWIIGTNLIMRQVVQSIRQNENSFTPSYGSINQVEWTDNFRLCQSGKIWSCFCIHSCNRFIFLVCVEVHKPLVMLLDAPVNLVSQRIKLCFCLWKYAAGAFCSPLCNPKSFCALSSLQDSLCGGLSGSLHNVEQDWCVGSCTKHRFWSWTSTTVFLLF